MNRVTFLIDGFNLYHSVRRAGKELQASTKWLDIRKLCVSYLPLIGKIVQEKAEVKSVYYFSAFAHHILKSDPKVIKRHKDFITCLTDSGISVEMSRFKDKDIVCPHCSKEFVKHEEKETDVAISVKLLEVLITGECDTAVMLSGDTDIAPALRTAQKLCPNKNILCAFPYKRKNRELSKIAPGSFRINKTQYVKYQLPDPYPLSDGTLISKPSSW